MIVAHRPKEFWKGYIAALKAVELLDPNHNKAIIDALKHNAAKEAFQ